MLPNETISIRHQLKDNIVKAGYSEEAAERALDGGGIGRREDSRFAGVQTHTPKQQQVMNEFASSTDNRIIEFVNKVRNLADKRVAEKIRMPIANVNKKAVNDIKSLTGIETSDCTVSIKGDAVVHIDNRHGENGQQDQSMADINNIARIPYVLDNYDTIEVLTDPKGNPVFDYRNVNSDGSPSVMLQLTKRIDGTFYVSEVVPDSARHEICIKSAYMSKKKGDTRSPTDAAISNPQITSEASRPSVPFSASTIPQSTADGNNSISPEQQNNSFAPGNTNDAPAPPVPPIPPDDPNDPGMPGNGGGDVFSAPPIDDTATGAAGEQQAEREFFTNSIPKSAEAGVEGMAAVESALIFGTTRQVVGMAETQAAAKSKLEQMGYDAAQDRFLASEKTSTNSVENAMAVELIKYFAANGRTRAAVEVAAKFGKLASEPGRSLNIIKLLQLSSPEGALMYANRIVEKATANKHTPEQRQEVQVTEEQVLAAVRDMESTVAQQVVDEISERIRISKKYNGLLC